MIMPIVMKAISLKQIQKRPQPYFNTLHPSNPHSSFTSSRTNAHRVQRLHQEPKKFSIASSIPGQEFPGMSFWILHFVSTQMMLSWMGLVLIKLLEETTIGKKCVEVFRKSTRR
jgi:hypothetical protein